MTRGEKLFTFPASLKLCEFYGTVSMRFGSGKVTDVQTETPRMWQCKTFHWRRSPSLGRA
jgi:hypothetical protein